MKKIILWILFISIFLHGCHSSPTENVVVNKNDHTFDINILESAEGNANSTQTVNRSDIFYSTDGTVEFHFTVEEEFSNRQLPVLMVEPHYLTEDDVRRVAIALFENNTLYEAEPLLDEILSQDDIQTKTQRWSKYTNAAALNDLYGGNGNSSDDLELIKNFIKNYTQMYENAPNGSSMEPCHWEFKKESYYYVDERSIANRDLADDSDSIAAAIHMDDVHYRFSALTRNKDDFKLNYITAYLYDGISPSDIDMRIFRANLCRTAEPTAEEIDAVKVKATGVLEEMQLGEWFIDECYVDIKYYGETPEYTIVINAVPVLNGIPAVRLPQQTFYTAEDAFAPNYDLTDIHFEYSTNGRLVNFTLHSPIDVVDAVNDNVKVLGIDDLLERAMKHLELSDYYEYGFGASIDLATEELGCIVTATDIEYNLIRMRAPNTEAGYYYVPGIVLFGDVEYYGKESGSVYYSSKSQILLSLNGIDGSVVGNSN